MKGNALEDYLNNYDLAMMEQSVTQSLERLGRFMPDLLFLHEGPLPEEIFNELTNHML